MYLISWTHPRGSRTLPVGKWKFNIDDTVPVLELTSIISSKNWSIDKIICKTSRFVDTVIIYICGFIMRSIIKKEKCTLCYTYLTECNNRGTCPLIDTKQLGGLIYPIADVVYIVNLQTGL
jgi:hypothetical protein